MISRFFKKKPSSPSKKATPTVESTKAKPSGLKKLLTAEGWKRMMMRKTGKGKK